MASAVPARPQSKSVGCRVGSAGTDGPTVAFRVVLEYGAEGAPTVDDVVAALQKCARVFYIEVQPGGDPCEEIGHLQGDPCLRCTNQDRSVSP